MLTRTNKPTFSPERIRRIATEHDAYWRNQRDDMALSQAIVETRFWEYYAGWGGRTGLFNWVLNGTEIEVNRLRKMMRTYLAALYARNPRVQCGIDLHDRGDPRVTAAVLNGWWNKPYAYLTMDDAAMLAMLFPGCGFKVGYDPGDSNPIERTWFEQIPPWELMLDREAQSYERERYRGHIYQSPIEEARERYPHVAEYIRGGSRVEFITDQQNPGSGGAAGGQSGTEDKGNSGNGMTEGEYVRILEFVNLRDVYVAPSGDAYRGRLEVYILDQGALCNDPVVCGPLPFADADGKPLPHLEPLIFEHRAGFPFKALSTIRSILPQQKELNLIRTQVLEDTRRNARKGVMREGSFEQDQIDKLNNAQDMQFAKMKQGVVGPLDEHIKMLEHQPIASDTMAWAQIVERDLNTNAVPSANSDGQATDATAYEVQTIQLHFEENIQYHSRIFYGTLGRVSKLVQCAVAGAGQDHGDSEGGDEADQAIGLTGEAVETEAPPTDDESPQPAKKMAKPVRAKTVQWKPFPIMDGPDKLTVEKEALIGDFPLTFVEADTTPVSRQTVLQFMTGPGSDKYLQLWDIVQKGGPAGMLAEGMMQQIADSLNLPKDIHPAAMKAKLAAEKPKDNEVKVRAPVSMQERQPVAEPEQAATDPRAALVGALGSALTTLARVANGSPEAKEALLPTGHALSAAIEAAKAGDDDALAASAGEALQALPEGAPDEVRTVLEKIVGALRETAPSDDDLPPVVAGDE